jgi:dipeptidyl aminopeptidase/acylaminoacyl peptidase
MLDKTFTEAPELYRRASPITHVRSNSPPILLVHGTADRTVSLKQSEILAKMLSDAGVEHEFVVVPGAIHSFDLQPAQRDLRPLVLGFFKRHL